MSTPSIPSVDREALAAEIEEATFVCSELTARRAADAAIAYIAAHQEPRVCACGAKYDRCPDCAADDAYERGRKDAACDLEHADEWVEVDQDTWLDLPDGVRVRQGWVRGLYGGYRYFVHSDDLPDPDAVWFRVLRDDTLDDAEREDWAGLLGHYGPLREATPADLARVGLGGRLRALADAPDPLEAPGTALGRAYRPYVTSGTVPTLNGAVAACHVCRGGPGMPCHPDPTEGDQA